MNRAGLILLTLGWLAAFPAGGAARTIVLTQQDTVMIASISAEHPFSSWACQDYGEGFFGMGNLMATPAAAALLQFPLDRIPRGQRVVNAELMVPVHIPPAAGSKLYAWRLLSGWGRGVSHVFRQVRPERLRWALAGARGPGTDRALEPTRVFVFPAAPRETRLDVTADVQLWYRGIAPNHGWMIATEDDNTGVPLLPPMAGYLWALQITFEPE